MPTARQPPLSALKNCMRTPSLGMRLMIVLVPSVKVTTAAVSLRTRNHVPSAGAASAETATVPVMPVLTMLSECGVAPMPVAAAAAVV